MGHLNEPDEKDWEHKGMRCILRRGGGGAWCGYVMVKSDHPWYEKDYPPKIGLIIEVHGGLTYSGRRLDGMESGWCFGFDCAHCWDISPNRDSTFNDETAQYRDINYVTKETERLADQLVEVKDLWKNKKKMDVEFINKFIMKFRLKHLDRLEEDPGFLERIANMMRDIISDDFDDYVRLNLNQEK